MRRDPGTPPAGSLADPLALTADEQMLVRRCARDPDEYVAVPVQAELDQGRPILLGEVPTPAGVQRLWAIPMNVYLREELAAYNDMMLDARGTPAHAPTRGMVPAAPTRLLLPKAQITDEGWRLLSGSAQAHARNEVRGWVFDPSPRTEAHGVVRWLYRRGASTRVAALWVDSSVVVFYEDGEVLARMSAVQGYAPEALAGDIEAEITRGRPGRLVLPGTGVRSDAPA